MSFSCIVIHLSLTFNKYLGSCFVTEGLVSTAEPVHFNSSLYLSASAPWCLHMCSEEIQKPKPVFRSSPYSAYNSVSLCCLTPESHHSSRSASSFRDCKCSWLPVLKSSFLQKDWSFVGFYHATDHASLVKCSQEWLLWCGLGKLRITQKGDCHCCIGMRPSLITWLASITCLTTEQLNVSSPYLLCLKSFINMRGLNLVFLGRKGSFSPYCGNGILIGLSWSSM